MARNVVPKLVLISIEMIEVMVIVMVVTILSSLGGRAYIDKRLTLSYSLSNGNANGNDKLNLSKPAAMFAPLVQADGLIGAWNKNVILDKVRDIKVVTQVGQNSSDDFPLLSNFTFCTGPITINQVERGEVCFFYYLYCIPSLDIYS